MKAHIKCETKYKRFVRRTVRDKRVTNVRTPNNHHKEQASAGNKKPSRRGSAQLGAAKEGRDREGKRKRDASYLRRDNDARDRADPKGIQPTKAPIR